MAARVRFYEFDRRAREYAQRLDGLRGDADCWHAEFGFAVTAVGARLYGAELHVIEIGSWELTTRPGKLLKHRVSNHVMAEHHAADALFNMDSAFEVLVYATNAIGYVVDPAGFLDFATYARGVGPADVLGGGKGKPLPGYAAHFPRFTEHCLANRDTILRLAFDLHDYSKHRSGVGGNMTLAHEDTFPPEFAHFKGKPQEYVNIVPPTVVLLPRFPKKIYPGTIPREDTTTLAEVHGEFCAFFEELLARWLEDMHEAVRRLSVSDT